MSDASNFLNRIRSKIGAPPRGLGWFKASPFAFPEPPWMAQASDADEPMKEIVRGLKSLWKHGIVVWGRVARANVKLYEPGDDDCPATLIFSPSAPDDEAMEELWVLVKKLQVLGDVPVSDSNWTQRETEWWEDMNNDMSYHRGFQLPEHWQTRSKDYKGSSLLLHRPHLPEGMIVSRILPLLVDPVASIAQVVPVSHWPEDLLPWLKANHGIEASPLAFAEWGESIQHLAGDPADRGEREAAYESVFGPIQSVFHEVLLSPHHIDVYRFHWPEPRHEHAYLTGGMSDAIQPRGGEYGRIELVIYTKEHHERFPNLLRAFARYPWESGSAIHPFDTVPLGDYAAGILGTDRFKSLMFFPGVAKPENAIHQAEPLAATKTRLLTVVPITDEELKFKLSHDLGELIELLREKRIDLAFDPNRPSFV